MMLSILNLHLYDLVLKKIDLYILGLASKWLYTLSPLALSFNLCLFNLK